MALAGIHAAAQETGPNPPQPAPPPPASAVPPAQPVTPREAALESRLRKMEEMYNKQFETMAKQNEALAKTVKDLSKKLDSVTKSAGTDAGAGGTTDERGGTRGDNVSLSVRSNERRPSSPSLSQPKQGPTRTPLKSFYDHRQRNRYGYVMQSEDEEYEIRFNGLLQADARINEPHNQIPVPNDLDIPRMRMYMSGRLTKPIEYQLSIQRSLNSLDLLNAYINLHYDDRIQLRFGRYKVPFTYEWYKESIWEMLTPERSPFANNFGGNRQVGGMAWGNLWKDRLEYAVGVFDGIRNSYQATTNPKDVMALIDFRPFYPLADSPLKNLSVGGSVDAGRENNPPVPDLLRTNVTAGSNSLLTGSGDALVAVPFLAFNSGVRRRGSGTSGNCTRTTSTKVCHCSPPGTAGDSYSLTTPGSRPVAIPVSGYLVQAGYILTGESLEKRALVEPIHPFDLRPGKFGLGALELQCRFSELGLGREVFTGGFADPNLWTNRVNVLDLGFNWYLTKNIKLYFDWQDNFYAQPIYFGPGPRLQKNAQLYGSGHNSTSRAPTVFLAHG